MKNEHDSNINYLNYGMVGGGPSSFIGAVHRKALSANGDNRLKAGCFSRDQDKNYQMLESLNIDRTRIYQSYKDMAQKEAELDDGIDFVVIVTPNSSHFSIAREFLNHGINVVCEKPLAVSLEEAMVLKEIKEKNGCDFCVTYTYTGYAMVKEARHIVQKGEIGDILFVNAEYAQGWLVDRLEDTGHKQAVWRMDPSQAGISSCIADLGSHVENLVSYITGLKPTKLLAKLDNVGEGRYLDTNAEVLVKYENGASGIYWCSQIAIGNENSLKIRIFGTEGSIEFDQENCNYLQVFKKNKPEKIYSRGNGYLSDQSINTSYLPAGHPEGYLDGYVNLYSKFSELLFDRIHERKIIEGEYDFPTIKDGIQSVIFINTCVESSKNGSIWVDIE